MAGRGSVTSDRIFTDQRVRNALVDAGFELLAVPDEYSHQIAGATTLRATGQPSGETTCANLPEAGALISAQRRSEIGDRIPRTTVTGTMQTLFKYLSGPRGPL